MRHGGYRTVGQEPTASATITGKAALHRASSYMTATTYLSKPLPYTRRRRVVKLEGFALRPAAARDAQRKNPPSAPLGVRFLYVRPGASHLPTEWTSAARETRGLHCHETSASACRFTLPCLSPSSTSRRSRRFNPPRHGPRLSGGGRRKGAAGLPTPRQRLIGARRAASSPRTRPGAAHTVRAAGKCPAQWVRRRSGRAAWQ